MASAVATAFGSVRVRRGAAVATSITAMKSSASFSPNSTEATRAVLPSRLGVLQETPLQIQAMKIAAAQIACTPGDLEANPRTIKDFASGAKDAGAELIVFPEMIDTGYSMPVIQKHATSWN